jgi:hypothetical protein
LEGSGHGLTEAISRPLPEDTEKSRVKIRIIGVPATSQTEKLPETCSGALHLDQPIQIFPLLILMISVASIMRVLINLHIILMGHGIKI